MNIYISGPIRDHKGWEENFNETEDFIRTNHLIPAIFGENKYNIVPPTRFKEFISQSYEQNKLRTNIENICEFFGTNQKIEFDEDSLGMTIALLLVNHWADVIYVCDTPNTKASSPQISLGMVAEGAIAKRRNLKFILEKKEKRTVFEKLLKIACSNAKILQENMAIILNTETGLMEIVKYVDHPILNDSLIYLATPESVDVEETIYQPFILAQKNTDKKIYVVLRLLD